MTESACVRRVVVAVATVCAVALSGCLSRGSHPGPDGPPATLLGEFVDDYGARYRVTADEWVQLPRSRYHVVRWNTREQYLIARNDSANRDAPGRWTRVDWITLTDMAPYAWAFCYSAYDAPSAASAEAADSVVHRDTPRTGCNKFPFSRMRKPTP